MTRLLCATSTSKHTDRFDAFHNEKLRTQMKQDESRLKAIRQEGDEEPDKEFFGDHSWRQQNHIWTEAEVMERMKTADMKHVPQDVADTVLQKMVRVAYHAFNFVTGYDHADPPTSAIGYRLIILESVAGVPGMLGGMFRHFRSLRQLERDHGFIFTLLEEAENERMHLIVCMSFFEAGPPREQLCRRGRSRSRPSWRACT